MNQIFLTGRIAAIKETVKGEDLVISIYQYDNDEFGIEQLPVEVNKKSSVYIGKIRPGDLVSIVGKLIVNNGILKIFAEKINYAG